MEVGSDRSDVERDQEPIGRCSESVELLWLYFHLEIEVNPVLRGLFFKLGLETIRAFTFGVICAIMEA